MGPELDLATASDPELVRAAQAGDAAAFAVLLRRHAGALRDLAAAPGGRRALERLGVRAMRSLRALPAEPGVADWLAGLAEDERRRLPADADGTPAPVGPIDADPRDWLDRWWSELSVRWPTGRRRYRIPGWLRATIAAAIIAAGGIVGTTALLRERPEPPVVAQVQAYAEPGRGDDFELDDDVDPNDELPVFVLPEEEPEPARPTPTPTTPAPPTTPTPTEPEPEPDGPAPTEPEPDGPAA